MAESSRGPNPNGWHVLLPIRRNQRRNLELPIEHVGLLSYLTYGWLDGFMWTAFRSGITEETLWKCPDVDGAEHNGERLERMWEQELSTKGRDKASLSAAFMRFIRKRLLVATFILVLAMALLLLSIAYFLLEVLKYSYMREHPLWVGLLLVFGFLMVDILQNVLFICVFSITHVAGARLRSGALLLLYRKLLTVSHLKNKTTGQIVNLFANDSQRIFDGVSMAPMLLVAPFLGIATTAYSIYLLGLWPLLGFAVLFFLFPIQMCIGKSIMTFRGRAMPITDKRIRMVGEMLANIKFIKMYCWEKPLFKDVSEVRGGERQLLEKVNMSTSLMFSVSAIVVAMATIATIMGHTLTGHTLTAVEAFIYLAIFSSIQSKLMLSAIAMKSFSELKVAADRFQEVLLLQDHKNPVDTEESRKSIISDSVIEMSNAKLSWDGAPSSADSCDEDEVTKNGVNKSDADTNTTNLELLALHQEAESSPEVLTDVNFTVRQGEIVGVTGPIGSGKSALITAVLGQMRIVRGTAKIQGKLAYVPQQAWLFNATLRENILFGNLYEQDRYDNVVRLCCLEMDFTILPQGDSTEVGERGVTLSGGQKQRISLARALYSNRDIFLLDDPFSAVDPDVADTLYQNLIQNALVGKTVIFTTHIAKYLPGCDMILFLRGGTIVEQGSHDELRDVGGEYYNYYLTMKEHDGETRDITAQIGDVPGTPIVEDEINENKPLLIRRQTRVKPKEIKEEAEKLVQREEQEAGAVSWRTYGVYTRAAGGGISVFIVVVLFILAEGSRAFSYWWIAHWLSQGSGNTTFLVERIVGNETVMVEELSANIADNPRLGFYNMVYGLTLLGTLVFFIIRAVVFTKLSMRASHTLHQRLIQKVLRCPMVFFDTTPLGRIMNRFSKDMDELDSQLPPMVEQTLQTIVSITMYIVMVSVIFHWFPIVIPPLLIIFAFVYAIFRVGLRDTKRLQNISMSPLLSHISATVQGIYSLHAYNKLPEFTARFVDMLDYNTVTTLLFNCCMRWINLRLSFITSFTACITALLVVLLPGVVQPEYAGLAIVYSTQLAGLFQFFTRSAAEAEARFTSAERINKYIEDLEPEPALIVANYRPAGDWPTAGQVTFKDYKMRYRDGLPLVLKGVDCKFKQGERIGIVGRTGSGKSSLASALFRLVEPCGGSIEVDGMDIGRMGLEDLRTRLSAIPQDPVLFSGTIRSNLDPSYRSIDEELWKALEKCNIKDLVLTLEGNLDAPVTEGGENFSAGERQLLCMARVLLRHSRILILDEATASMDAETDSLLQEALKAAFSSCTLLIIAHRLSTVLTSDRVLVMEKGEIVEFDTPAALRANPDSRFNALMAVTTDNKDVFKDDASDILASDAWV